MQEIKQKHLDECMYLNRQFDVQIYLKYNTKKNLKNNIFDASITVNNIDVKINNDSFFNNLKIELKNESFDIVNVPSIFEMHVYKMDKIPECLRYFIHKYLTSKHLGLEPAKLQY